ncbi:MAG: trigger factor [Chloroflexi bacterium]|nr:trigger factor [Chloroflexota bacterium]
MNLQTERIDNHRAQFTIEIETDQLEEAKRQAARKISRQVRIKGFRKGKAPYRLVAQYVGEGAILEEALEALGDDLYKQALDEADVAPYGPGAFEDFKSEPTPTFVFSVPLQPEVDLCDYLDVRLDFEEPEVGDGEIDYGLKHLQMGQVEVLDDEIDVAGPGHRVTIAVDSEFVDGDPPDEAEAVAIEDALTAGDDQADETEADGPPEPYVPRKGDTFVKDDHTQIILDPNEDPFIHGFVGNLIGVERGSDVEFELTIPDDDVEETIIGRQVSFVVTIKDIEAIAIPEMDDEFARRMSRERGDEESDLAGLRQSIRDEMTRIALDDARSEYSASVLDLIVDGAEIAYPDVMLTEGIDDMVGEFEANLKQRKLSLDQYLRMSNSTMDALREEYREQATQGLRQNLVLRELFDALDVEITEDQIDTRLDSVIARYGPGPELRKLFDTPQMRGNARNELMMNRLNAHLLAIGRGQDPAVALEEFDSRLAADAERARDRSERLRRYRAEDAATDKDDAAESETERDDGAQSDGASHLEAQPAIETQRAEE